MGPEPILFPVNFVNWMKRNSVHIFVAISALSLFDSLHLFLRGRGKRDRESNTDKKMHGVPFHRLIGPLAVGCRVLNLSHAGSILINISNKLFIIFT